MSKEYKEKQQYIDTIKTKELLTTLPPFCTDYYNGRKIRLTPKTQLDYVRKMSIFLTYLHDNNSYFGAKKINEITLDDLALLKPSDIREFVAWILEQQARPNSYALNKKSTAENYIACLSSYWNFFCKEGMLTSNPFLAIDREKRKKKDIIYLQENQKDSFRAAFTYGEGLSDRQLIFHDKNYLRELCICQILLDTGIRVSELVGLDLDDIDFDNCKLSIQRKGDKPDTVYFSDETKEIIKEYLETRSLYQPVDDEQALFLVSIGKYKGERLGVRSVERLVKRYALAAHIPQAKEISPHKLRSTYAMDMLRKTHNLPLVSEQLGHESINTTQLYARSEEREKKENRNILMNNQLPCGESYGSGTLS